MKNRYSIRLLVIVFLSAFAMGICYSCSDDDINGKTNCSTFTKHFVPNLILLTQNKMCILLRWFPIYQFCLSLHQFSIGAKAPFIIKEINTTASS